MLIATIIAVVVITGGLSAWLLSAPSYDRTTARGVSEAFAHAMNSKNIEGAKELLCRQDQFDFTRGDGSFLQVASLTLVDVQATDDDGTATYRLQANLGSDEVSVALTHDSESGEWSVCPSATEN